VVLDTLRDRLRDDEGPAIVVEGLTETFRLYHEKPSGLKERLYRFSRPTYTDFNALEDVSFRVLQGEAVGVVGHNGSGKSTLLKVLARILPPDEGSVHTRGRVASLLELGAGFHGDLSGRENIYLNGAILGLTRAEIAERFDEIVEFSGVGPFLDTAVRNYSSGMYVRLGFAIAVTVAPDVLLIDEVLSVGDAEFQHRSLERMRHFRDAGKTLLVVSHDLAAIESLCERVIVLDRGRVAFDGSVGQGLALYRQLTSVVKRSDEDGDERSRHRSVEVVGGSLTDRSGEAVAAVDPGRPLLLRVRIRADDDLPACSVGARVEGRDGSDVYETHSAWHGLGIGPLQAGQEAVVEMRLNANLLAGHHRVHPVVTDASARFAWAFGEPLNLEIVPTRGATGVADLAASFAVSEGPALRLGADRDAGTAAGDSSGPI
jgi:ABC-type polysaccharide/polyol phosphate transport system ATPase subunit